MNRWSFRFACACGAALILAATPAWLTGCAHTAKIQYRYDADGTPVSFRRCERNITRDFLHHFSRQAYRRPAPGMDRSLSADQKPIVDQLGLPDWVRRPFVSYQGERVDEWICLDAMQVFQFIGGKMVFQGPLTDYEQVLLRHGYPSHMISNSADTGHQIDLFIYDDVFRPSIQQFYFVDGTIKQMQEGN